MAQSQGATKHVSRFELVNGSKHFYRPQRSCGKVMFLHLSVILSPDTPLGRHTSPQADPLLHQADDPPPTRQPLQWTVCILLECILVKVKFTSAWSEESPAIYLYHYRPQRSCGQGYVFTHVYDSVHRGGLQQGEPPPQQGDPHPPGRENPPVGIPPAGRTHLLTGRPPWQGGPPAGRLPLPIIWSMSGRYASYWNAFLF